MSKHFPRHPPIVTHRPRASRFVDAPETPDYKRQVWDALKRYAPDKIPALIDRAHDEGLVLNRAWDVRENKEMS